MQEYPPFNEEIIWEFLAQQELDIKHALAQENNYYVRKILYEMQERIIAIRLSLQYNGYEEIWGDIRD